MLWYCNGGILENLDMHLCAADPIRRPTIFFHSLTCLNEKIMNKQWKSIPRLWAKRRAATGKTNIFECGKIIIAHNENLHYTFYAIYITAKQIVYHDSFNENTEPKTFPVQYIWEWLEYEAHDAKIQFSREEWSFAFAKVVHQGNGVDCGFHIIKNTLLIMLGLPLLLHIEVNTSQREFLEYINFIIMYIIFFLFRRLV